MRSRHELANLETKLNVLGDAQTTDEEDMEQLDAKRDLIVEEVEQTVALEAKMRGVWVGTEELVEELTRDQF